jgi:hypothetical protein
VVGSSSLNGSRVLTTYSEFLGEGEGCVTYVFSFSERVGGVARMIPGERGMCGGVCRADGIDVSLETLIWPGLLFPTITWVGWRCFAGGIPRPAIILRSAPGGDGVDRVSGLLLCIDDDIDAEGVIYKELLARVRLPSMF